MSEKTGIEWCDHTFNIAWGCFKVSPGCAHCYADTLSRRYGHDVWGPPKTTARRTFGDKHWAEPLKWNAAAEREGARKRVFCSSMCDVFEEHPTIDAEREKLWPLIRATPHLDWLLLTKRPERIAANLPSDWGNGYANVWLGTSVESAEYAFDRVLSLLATRAAVRFLSCEPLLGPVDNQLGILCCIKTNAENEAAPEADVAGYDRPGIHWIIVGGESGPGARPMDEAWARGIRRVCEQTGIAFFLKQLGGARDKRGGDAAMLDGVRHVEWPSRPPLPTGGEE